MNAIPTKYAGVQFRSRLEARWAAMFDLLSWRWEYEPCDLEGWIPDFFVYWKRGPKNPIAIEIKPYKKFNEEAARKVDGSGLFRQTECGAVLLLGDFVYPHGNYTSSGWIRVPDITGEKWDTACWDMQGYNPGNGEYTLRPTPFSEELTCFPPETWRHDSADLVMLWREAQNKCQWRSPNGPS